MTSIAEGEKAFEAAAAALAGDGAAALADEHTPTKVCSGPCGRELPLDAEHFHRRAEASTGFASRCKECTAATVKAKRRRQRPPKPPPSESRKPPLNFSVPGSQGRLDLIRRRVDMAPTNKAEAAERVRRIMQAADAAVKRRQGV